MILLRYIRHHYRDGFAIHWWNVGKASSVKDCVSVRQGFEPNLASEVWRRDSRKRGIKLRRGFAFVMLFAFAFLVHRANAQSLAPPPIGPACPPEQPGGVFQNFAFVGGSVAGPPFFAIQNCDFAQVATIASTLQVGTTGLIHLTNVGIADSAGDTVSTWDSSNVKVNQGWLSAGIVGDNLDVTINASAISGSPGYYDAQITVSGQDQGVPVIASSWNLRVIVQGAAPTNLSASLLDPVPDFLDGPAVSTDTNLLAVDSHVVRGVAADGVTQLVLGVHADNVGDQISITLLNDEQPPVQSGSPDEDGALGNLGTTSFTASQVTASAVSTTANGPEAFAIYRAPIDFARLVGGVAGSYKTGSCRDVTQTSGNLINVTATDDQLACRSVSLQVQDLTNGALTFATITILRPPVVMIHGLWDDWTAWDSFSPLVTGRSSVDPRFYVGRVSYDNLVGPSIILSDPAYPLDKRLQVKANSLGFAFNAPNVLAQTEGSIGNFKQGKNPLSIPVAAVQADIVAHSMGGDIARTLVLQPNFLGGTTYGQGSIHKLVTIDTPHLGSPLAQLLLSPQEDGGCLESELAKNGDFVFNTAFLANLGAVDGAMADLQPSSPALNLLTQSAPHPLPTALVAGVYVNFSALDTVVPTATPFEIRLVCGSIEGDPLAKDFTSSGWQGIFGGDQNDAIVSVTSQTNNSLGNNNVFVFVGASGYVHSQGTERLGFTFPSVLDPGDIPNEVIKLLNTPLTQPAAFGPLDP
ncbi:MAG: esterase/lipase family protein [Candidatus Acidiferrales bacterium]